MLRWVVLSAIGLAVSLASLRAIHAGLFDQWMTVSRATLAAAIHPETGRPAVIAPPCGARQAPPPGQVVLLDPSVMRRGDATYFGIKAINRLPSPLTVELGQAGTPAAYLYLSPGQQTEISAPAGDYRVILKTGTQWCGGEFDFRNEKRFLLSTPLSVAKFSALELEPDPAIPGGISATRHEREAPPPPPPVIQDAGGGLALPADSAGHYRVDGSVNNHPVRFLIDTGATGIALSREAANRAGLYHCPVTERHFTANGPVDVCHMENIPVQFGPYRMENMRIAILPYLEGDALLGMSALRNFRMEQSGSVLRISRN